MWRLGSKEGLWLLAEMTVGRTGRRQGGLEGGHQHLMKDSLGGMNAREDDAWVSGLSSGRDVRPFTEVGAEESQ